MELVSVAAEKVYYEPIRPLAGPAVGAAGDTRQLNIADVLGKQVIETRNIGPVIVREENAAAALEHNLTSSSLIWSHKRTRLEWNCAGLPETRSLSCIE
jgi:hypothetical protein